MKSRATLFGSSLCGVVHDETLTCCGVGFARLPWQPDNPYDTGTDFKNVLLEYGHSICLNSYHFFSKGRICQKSGLVEKTRTRVG